VHGWIDAHSPTEFVAASRRLGRGDEQIRAVLRERGGLDEAGIGRLLAGPWGKGQNGGGLPSALARKRVGEIGMYVPRELQF